MKHKHYKEIIAWANGETIQAFDTSLLTWNDITIYEPSWHPQIQYRVKPNWFWRKMQFLILGNGG